jgi:RNA polymerase sigma factor (TIGR02999 family)
MRRVLVDYARQHRAAKRGGEQRPVTLDEAAVAVEGRAETLIALDDALTRLASLDERLSRVVECRFFGGLTEEETADALQVTSRTVRRDWVKAKGWLYQEMQADVA